MKTRYGVLLIFSIFLITSLWGCKSNIVGINAPKTVIVTGTVFSSNTPTPVAGATVVLSYGGISDSSVTGSDGTFAFTVDISDTVSGVNISLVVHASGFLTKSISGTLKSSQYFPIGMDINPAAFAVVSGTVRDSASSYPLSGANVLISLPGGSSITEKYISNLKSNRAYSVSSFLLDSTSTLANGTFTLDINMFGLESLPATMTISKEGFKSYQIAYTFKSGANAFGNILLQIDNAQSVAHLIGRVVDNQSQLPLTGVSVVLSSSLKTDSTKTLSDGSYSFDENLQGLSSFSGTLKFKLTSYNDTTVNFSASAGQTVTENIALSAKSVVVGGNGNTGRGVPQSFYLVSGYPQPNELSIHGVGGRETSLVVWQVLDSLGFPLDINHRATVSFTISGAAATGGAYVSPSVDSTDGSGEVRTTINSGTIAGTIQLNAQLTRPDGRVVESEPVLITVDGGLPDQAHFSFGVGQTNFAGYDWVGRTNTLLVQAGDKYGNPCHPGTAIYFTSEWGGIAIAPGYTSAIGQANSTLYSGNPLPKLSGLDPSLYGDGTGYGYVKASTYGEDSVVVADSALVLFSATIAPIVVPDTSMNIKSGGNISIPVHISDRYGNPLEPGTTISVAVKLPPVPANSSASWSVDVGGNLPSVLPDYLTRGPGRTDFTLVLSGTMVGNSTPIAYTATITVTGRNGNATSSVSGAILP